MIRSRARAREVVETIAAKYNLEPTTVLCAKWDRFAKFARAELAHTLTTPPFEWPQRMVGAYLGCTHTNVRKLLSFHKMSGPKLYQIAAAIHPTVAADDRVRFLTDEIRRLSGQHHAEILARSLDMPFRCAVVLGILVEHYPNHVRLPAMRDLYDEACIHFGYGKKGGVSENLMQKNFQTLGERFAAIGVPSPTELGPISGSRRLTDVAALWLLERFDGAVVRWRQIHHASPGIQRPLHEARVA